MHDLVTRASFDRPEYISQHSAWLDYAPVAFWLIDALRPGCIVELGVHAGFSYFAFCQQIKKLKLECYSFGVDTFEGDEHSLKYGPAVLSFVKSHNVRYEPFSMLVQGTFEEAAKTFPDGSIDLLHIDGFHEYKAVAADYNVYRRKLSDKGVVLFHDTNLQMPGYEVKRFFDEVRATHPSFEFTHGCGLGLMAPGEAPDVFAELCVLSQRGVDWIRHVYSALGFNIMMHMPEYQDGDIDGIIAATKEIARAA